MQFDELFRAGTGFDGPFPYQRRLALDEPFPELLNIPTGLGKTEAVVLAWLWRRRFASPEVRQQTPRRLVYCLPMRVLVEQTRDRIHGILQRLELLATEPGPPDRIAVSVLMGGEDEDRWDAWPERDAILVGTQDMLLSRALNRGYAMSRFRWPVAFGLLNNDCLWVMDEVQLMGSGLATTLQFHAFRESLGTWSGCRSLWMSATVERDAFCTVDHPSVPEPRGLQPEDRARCVRLLEASKPLTRLDVAPEDIKTLASLVLDANAPGRLTLVVLNTVERVRQLFLEVKRLAAKRWKASPADAPDLRLLHSRFRPADRRRWSPLLARDALIPPAGRIIVSTQVVEAGVDLSAAVLFTDLAPWSSLVQRFGRCNRRGEHGEAEARVFVLPALRKPEPYDAASLEAASIAIARLANVSPASIEAAGPVASPTRTGKPVLRRKDLVDLFDTTPDLAGNDIDVSRFIRDGGQADAHLFWRTDGPVDGLLSQPPCRDEICPVPVGSAREFLAELAERARGKPSAWRFDPLDGRWVLARPDAVRPGVEFLILANIGGYSPDVGFAPSSKEPVEVVRPSHAGRGRGCAQEGHSGDGQCIAPYLTIARHTDQVVRVLDDVLQEIQLPSPFLEPLRRAARWHDRGKAHEVFQDRILRDGPAADPARRQDLAKAPDDRWARNYKRKHFRHELASALSAIDSGLPALAVYLVAAHHGRVRLLLRSMPDETRPPEPGRRFCRGVWDGDVLAETELGSGEVAPPVRLSLEPAELGLSSSGRPSWTEAMTRLRDDINPFRLAYLEALLRSADGRASAIDAGDNPLLEADHG